MTNTTAQIAAKGCSSTGITETLAEQCHDQLGKKILAIVELSSHQATTDHLRELARAFHYERRLADGQLTIDTASDLEPKVADVMAARPDLRPAPDAFLLPGEPNDDEEE